MNKKKILIFSLIFITVIILGFIAATFLLEEKPTLPGRATESPSSTPIPTGPVCRDNSGSCSWSADATATEFRVRITDETSGQSIIDTITTENVVYFTPLVDHTYKCIVTALNSCSESPEESATSTCSAQFTPTPTMSHTPTPSNTLTPSPTGVLTPSPTEELTPTPTDELTPTPSDEPTPTVKFSPTPTVEDSPTPKPSNTPTEIVLISETPPPATPTIPESGIPAHWIFILLPLSILIFGLIF